jgi:hypothetical protein
MGWPSRLGDPLPKMASSREIKKAAGNMPSGPTGLKIAYPNIENQLPR